jgi:hypothetical protein
MGPKGWKAAYGVVSLVGFVLICYGYGLSRQAPIDLFNPPVWTRHLAALITLPAFVLLVAGQIPGTYIKQAVKHPMVLGTKPGPSHLIANDRDVSSSARSWGILDLRRRVVATSAWPHLPGHSVLRDIRLSSSASSPGRRSRCVPRRVVGVAPFGRWRPPGREPAPESHRRSSRLCRRVAGVVRS